jgi:hypothetical protein
MAAIAMETAKMIKKIEKHKNDHKKLPHSTVDIPTNFHEV